MLDLNDPLEEKRRKEETHRLRDIRPEEVSLVDRAANRKVFLLVKRSSDMNNLEEVHEADDGTLTTDQTTETTEPEPSAESAPEHEVEKADEPKAETETKADEEPVEKAEEPVEKAEEEPVEKALVIAAPIQAAMVKVLTECDEQLKAVLAKVKGAKAIDGKVPVPPEVMAEIMATHKLLGTIGEKAPAKTEKATRRRMTAGRIKRLKEALTLLFKLLEEVEVSPRKEQPKEEEKAAEQPAAFPLFDQLIESQKALTDEVRKMSGHLTTQEQRIVKMESFEATPRSRESEVTKPKGKDTEDTGWSLDLNAPVTKESAPDDANFWEV